MNSAPKTAEMQAAPTTIPAMAPPPKCFVGSTAGLDVSGLELVLDIESVDDVEGDVSTVSRDITTASVSVQSTTNAGASTVVAKGYRRDFGANWSFVEAPLDSVSTRLVASSATDTVACFRQGY